MIKTYYDASTLEAVVSHLEETYGMSSEEFTGRIEAGEEIPAMSGFHRHTWLSFFRDIRRLRGDAFASTAARVLTGAR
ncbi:MAG TPA: hypothetical protein VFV91_10710 [Gaiellaceae bacterium]|nr:hypothetical protein [Gaiellaceae bacterium]